MNSSNTINRAMHSTPCSSLKTTLHFAYRLCLWAFVTHIIQSDSLIIQNSFITLKQSLSRSFTGPWGSRRLRPRFRVSRHEKVVRLSALRTGRLYPPGNIPGTHFCSCDPEELRQWKIPWTPSRPFLLQRSAVPQPIAFIYCLCNGDAVRLELDF
jgi:hypothetical protein